MTRSLVVAALVWGAALVLPAEVVAKAQARDGRLQVTVVDQTGGVLPGSTVTIAGIDDSTKATTRPPVTATAQGVAMFEGLPPGRYALKAEFPGFDARINPDVRVRAGDNRQTLSLTLQKIADTVTVARDRQEVAVERTTTFGSALTREQIEALSDDPAVLAQQLQQMAGGPAVIRVDSFEGAPLPPKSQIKSIHITRDGFAAENHNAGAFFIDVVTQPGLGPLRGQVQYGARPGTLTGNSPFTPVKGAENLQIAQMAIGGTLAHDRSSFSLNLQGVSSYLTPNLNVFTPAGQSARALNIKTPSNTFFLQGLIDYALTKDQTVRVAFNTNHNATDNLGVGAFDLPERAYAATNRFSNLRLQESGPLGRRFFINTRLGVSWSHNDQQSVLDISTIQVLDAFTSGGAQMAGERHSTAVVLASDLDYVRGRHSVRSGFQIDTSAWHSTLNSNYLGTYVFTSLAAFQAGTPSNFTRRIGDPNVGYSMLNAAAYIQDDFRIRRNLTISPGIRYERQGHVGDWKDLGPRVGVTWAPFKSGRTALRASAGVFYDWLNQTTLEQVERVDGFHQQELNVANPSFPTTAAAATALAANRYFLDPNVQSPRSTRFSGGAEQTLYASPTWGMRTSVLYAFTRTDHAWRGLNENRLVAGHRDDPQFANVVDVVSDALAEQHQLSLTWNIGLPPQPPGNEIPHWFMWKRFAFYGNYSITHARNNTDGDFVLPPGGTLVDEWGRSALDVPSRFYFNFISLQFKRTQISGTVYQQSGMLYTETTGVDANEDGLFNDRLPGVARNSLRGEDQWGLSLYAAYMLSLRRRATPLTGIVATQFSGSTVSNLGTFADTVRYRLTFSVQAQNLTNRNDYTGYSGVLTSPFFRQPTAVVGPRRIIFNIAFNF